MRPPNVRSPALEAPGSRNACLNGGRDGSEDRPPHHDPQACNLRLQVLDDLHHRAAELRREAIRVESAIIALKHGLVTPAEALAMAPDPNDCESLGAIYSAS